MQIVTFVKNVDDFGKKKLSGSTYEYSQHYPRVSKGDLLVYFYPNEYMVGLYMVEKEVEYHNKEGFQYCNGLMTRFPNSVQIDIENIKKQNLETGLKLEKIINETVIKHFK